MSNCGLDLNRKDPVDGLIGYVKEIKPYHTKIMEVLVEYVHEDEINVDIDEQYSMDHRINVPYFKCTASSYGKIYGFPNKPIYNVISDGFEIEGDYTSVYQPDMQINVVGSNSNNDDYSISTVELDKSGTTTTKLHLNNPSDITDKNDTTGYIETEQVLDDYVIDIIYVDNVTNELLVNGNWTNTFTQRSVLTVVYSGDMNGSYTISGTSFDGHNTRIEVDADIFCQKISYPVNQGYGLQFDSDDRIFEYTDNTGQLHLSPNTPILDVTTDYISVEGDQTQIISTGMLVRVLDSTDNDGVYVVEKTEFDSAAKRTKIFVEQQLSDSTVDGYVTLEPFTMQNTSGTTFEVQGDKTTVFQPDTYVTITNSPRNKGTYQVLTSQIRDVSTNPITTVYLYHVLAEQDGLVYHAKPGFSQAHNETQTAVGNLNVFIDEEIFFEQTIERFDGFEVHNLENTDNKGFDYDGGELNLSDGYGVIFDSAPHTYFHDTETFSIDQTNNAITLYNGNFVDRFYDRIAIDSYSTTNFNGRWFSPLLTVTNIDTSGGVGEHTLSVNSEYLWLFEVGTWFYITNTQTNSGWFSVKEVGTTSNPYLKVNEELTALTYSNGPLQDVGSIVGAVFKPANPSQGTIPRTEIAINSYNISITELQSTAQAVIVEGDYQNTFVEGMSFTITDSANNDNTYTITKVQPYPVTSNVQTQTRLFVDQAVSDDQLVVNVYNSGWVNTNAYIQNNTPAQPTDGEYWFDPATQTLRQFDDGTNQWIIKQPIVQTTAPSGSDGDLWVEYAGLMNVSLQADTEYLSYFWYGPYSLYQTIDKGTGISTTFQEDTDISDELAFISSSYQIVSANKNTNTFSMYAEDTAQNTYTFVGNWYEYDITNVNLTDNTITVVGDATADIESGTEIQIVNSSGNNGAYDVVFDENITNVYDSNNDTTTFKVIPSLSSATADGYVQPKEYQQNYTGNPISLTSIFHAGTIFRVIGSNGNDAHYVVKYSEFDSNTGITDVVIDTDSQSLPSFNNTDYERDDFRLYIQAVPETTEVTTPGDSSNSLDGTYWTLHTPNTDYYVWYNTGAGAGDPGATGTGVEVEIPTDATAQDVANATAFVLNNMADFDAYASVDVVTITNTTTGDATDAANNNTGVTVNVVTQGNDIAPEPFGRAQHVKSSTQLVAEASIVDSLEIGWVVNAWFQYNIVAVDTTDDIITVSGNATRDISPGQTLTVVGSTGNNGVYSVVFSNEYPVKYNSSNDTTTFKVLPELTSTVADGFIEPREELEAGITLTDFIGITIEEASVGEVVATGGSLMDSWDYVYWDIGSWDEDFGALIRLYSS